MSISLISASDTGHMERFVSVLNDAFLERSKADPRIPFEPLSLNALLCDMTSSKASAYGFFEGEELLGGLCVKYRSSQGAKLALVYHVFSAPGRQRKGIGTALMRHAEREAQLAGARLIRVNSANVIAHINRLYTRLGYKPLQIYAGEPHTYYFIRYIKPLPPHKYPEIKRLWSLFVSTVKFRLLFAQDSTPNLLHRMIYGKR